MAFTNPPRGAAAPMAEINMIPLIDVMLVLLVIFLVTAPLLTHAVKVELPRGSSMPNPTPPQAVQLAVTSEGRVTWNGALLERDAWRARMAEAAARKPQPELHLRADRAVPYGRVAEVMADAARAGLGRIGFVTDPRDTQ